MQQGQAGGKTCPCKRIRCKRHGDCAACRAHHAADKKYPPYCEKGQKQKSVGAQKN